MLSKKICLVGRFGVGKTSLVDRYVKNHFSEKYHTTVGVSISTKVVDEWVKLIIWDIAGFEERNHYVPYLRGTHGLIYVADATAPESIDVLAHIKEANPSIHDLPSIGLINKSDLVTETKLDDLHLNTVKQITPQHLWTSAKTGENVEKAFFLLSESLK